MYNKMISADELTCRLSGTMWNEIKVFDSIPSTNDYLKTCSDFHEGTAVFALTQTGGRGRLGRTWVSPKSGNIYLSAGFEPALPTEKMPQIGFAAAVAVCEALNEFFAIDCHIKWPNDIVAENRKLCGILCELVFCGDTPARCICGIGINLLSAPKEGIPAIAVSDLYKDEYNINEFSAVLLKKLEFEYNNIENVLEKYKKSCITLGREIRVISSEKEYTARAVSIDTLGRLIVEKNGEKISINSGEVSVRGIYDYC